MRHFNQVFSNIRYQVRPDPDIELESIETNFSAVKKDLEYLIADSGISPEDALVQVEQRSRLNGIMAREPWFEEELEREKWEINTKKKMITGHRTGLKKVSLCLGAGKVQIVHVANFKDNAGWTTAGKTKANQGNKPGL